MLGKKSQEPSPETTTQEDVDPHLENMRARALLHYLWILVSSAVLIVGDKLGWFAGFYEWMQHFLRELGFAGLVATALVFALERFSKERNERETKHQIRRINRDLFLAIFRRQLPAGVIAEVQDALFYTKLVRNNLALTYKLERVPNPSKTDPNYPSKELVKVDYSASFELENVTLKPVQHELKTYIELPIWPELQSACAITSVQLTRARGDGKPQELIRSPVTSATSDHTAIVHCHPIDLSQGECVRISVKAHFYKNLFDTEVWNSLLPTQGCRLQVIIPGKNLLVKARAYNSKSFVDEQKDPTVYEWVLQNGMFPHQGVSFWWSPL